ncbi:DNA (cytosine-5-)-methyltransferase [Pseudomonas sp. AFG_SD02_1510_Pfu_092]|uniref:DNA cytosine methyltransferase n=1 Tax=Pseudomonas sp. AFG_SD02_1510_Pfu_092 TaxID=2259497 RepID=UPI000DEF0D79|nr:DNA cytosine methyltransferase [Pseudomonas sp. AFG_SD02_1510_Pfu_092]RCL28692.1 DNA (cytosine-5-)-methyltransferase [Pseudomonas sp. AFG_SD02_1510_Pfu_092]
MNDKQLNILDLFCGTGALSYGLTHSNSSFQVVGGIDLNRSASETAAANHPGAKIFCDDINNFTAQQMADKIGISRIDLIVGGPPCQGFSSIRPSRGQGLQDPRNFLYKKFVDYVSTLRPTVFLMENVVGIIGANGGELLNSIIMSFNEIGYDVDWRVLNAANYGVPQKRERFFMLGVKRSAVSSSVLIFPDPTHRFSGRVIGTRIKEKYIQNPTNGLSAVTLWDALSDLPRLRSGEESERYAHAPLNSYQLMRRMNAPKQLRLHQAANHSAKMLEVIRHSGSSKSCLPEGLVTSGYSSCYSRLEKEEPATTITVKFTSPASSKCIHPVDDRAITPREAARLQSFDDSFLFRGSKTDIASQIGNAVPPVLSSAFSGVISEILASKVAVEEI